MIKLENFTKVYGNFTALDKINCTFEDNLITGILGPNGAGKTTLLKAICGRHCASDGKILVTTNQGAEIDASEEIQKIRNLTGFVQEAAEFPGEYTVKEFLTLVCELHNSPKENIEECIKLFSLNDVLYKKTGTLSKGYKERLNFAQAFVYKPEILVLDEPASGLDPQQIINMRQTVKLLAKTHTIILSTHIMQEAESLCDKIIILNHGKILDSGTIEEILLKTKCSKLEEAFFKLIRNS